MLSSKTEYPFEIFDRGYAVRSRRGMLVPAGNEKKTRGTDIEGSQADTDGRSHLFIKGRHGSRGRLSQDPREIARKTDNTRPIRSLSGVRVLRVEDSREYRRRGDRE